jgi:regulator of sigma E protease
MLLIVEILLGLAGLGIVVMAHEFGHYLAGRAMGVEVEAFSIGWGPKIASFKRGGTEWRISAFPLGGYCKFKGEESFRQALERKLPELPREPGSLYGASPWRRIVVSVAGPLANVILAAIIFIVASTIGYSVPTYPNKIVLLSEYNLGGTAGTKYPADEAGLKTGDRVLSVDGKSVADFLDLYGAITMSPGKTMSLEVERDGVTMRKSVTPKMRPNGSGYIGISNWGEPVVASLAKGGAAEIAGVQAGDRIVAVDGRAVRHSAEALSILNSSKPERATVTVERGGARLDLVAILNWKADGSSNLGISFAGVEHYVVPATTLGQALSSGLTETWNTFATTLAGLATLFKGVNLFEALSGPARITYMVGQTATEGISRSASGGLAFPLNFLGFLSIGLFIMNLLPIPALDGGQSVIHLIEIFRRKPLKPITIYRYQLVGIVFILGIFVIATVGDLLFFAGPK